MPAHHYRTNVRDLEFALFDALGLGAAFDDGRTGFDLDTATITSMLTAAADLAEGPLAASFTDADRNPATFDPSTGMLELPDTLKQSYRAYVDGGWHKLSVPEELGGIPLPPVVHWALTEVLCGANPALYFYTYGSYFASIFHANATQEQRGWAKIAAERDWGATMMLTEPDAGSDVGAGRTRAIAQPDGSWHLEGTKRFITSAESGDLVENILHFVLARPEGAGPGTKGLSLFVAPKFHFDPATGRIGERNGVVVTHVEHKMGLKSSATCEVALGAGDTPATAWLVGEVHDGIAQMFTILENARLSIAVKSTAALSSAYLNALAYATERVQGADLARANDKTAPRVTIIHHPDVRRSLLLQKAYAEGLRALYLFTAAHRTPELAAVVSGADAETAAAVGDLLLPVAKACGSERAHQYLTEALQCLGGSGFLTEYPIEQYLRDTKIDSLYEGTTAIQSLDFVFRKVVRDQGGALEHVLSRIEASLVVQDQTWAREQVALRVALADVRAMTATLLQHAATSRHEPDRAHRIGLVSVRYLLAVGDVLIGWLLWEQARTASRPDSEVTADFREGKVAAARFFLRTVLADVAAARQVVENADADVMDLPVTAF